MVDLRGRSALARGDAVRCKGSVGDGQGLVGSTEVSGGGDEDRRRRAEGGEAAVGDAAFAVVGIAIAVFVGVAVLVIGAGAVVVAVIGDLGPRRLVMVVAPQGVEADVQPGA